MCIRDRFCYVVVRWAETGNKSGRFIKHCCATLGRAVVRFVGNIPVYLLHALVVALATAACLLFTVLVIGATLGVASLFVFAAPWIAVKRIRKAYKAFE